VSDSTLLPDRLPYLCDSLLSDSAEIRWPYQGALTCARPGRPGSRKSILKPLAKQFPDRTAEFDPALPRKGEPYFVFLSGLWSLACRGSIVLLENVPVRWVPIHRMGCTCRGKEQNKEN
jgi:hypothetical protein